MDTPPPALRRQKNGGLFNLRLNPEERTRIKAAAEAENISESAVVRRLISTLGRGAPPFDFDGLQLAFDVLRSTPGGHGQALQAVAQVLHPHPDSG